MIIYVDGFNAIHTNRLKGSKSELMEALLHLTAQSIHLSDSAHIVFDGFPVVIVNPFTHIKLYFSGNDIADDYIVRLIQKKRLKKSASITLFSNDNELKNRVKQLGVNALGVKQLNSEAIGKSSKKIKKEDVKEIPFDSTLLDGLLAHTFKK